VSLEVDEAARLFGVDIFGLGARSRVSGQRISEHWPRVAPNGGNLESLRRAPRRRVGRSGRDQGRRRRKSWVCISPGPPSADVLRQWASAINRLCRAPSGEAAPTTLQSCRPGHR